MIEAVWDNAFKRSYRKRIHRVPHLKNQFREKMELFLEEPFDPHLRTHAPPRGSQKTTIRSLRSGKMRYQLSAKSYQEKGKHRQQITGNR